MFLEEKVLTSCFGLKSAALKEAIDDLEWPGSSIQITLQPVPPSVTFKGEGHGDLQIDFMYYANMDLLVSFNCDQVVSHRHAFFISSHNLFQTCNISFDRKKNENFSVIW